MKDAIRQVSANFPLDLEEVDVDGAAGLQAEFGDEVPVLFIDGRKAFKYRVTAKELSRRLGRGASWKQWLSVKRGD